MKLKQKYENILKTPTLTSLYSHAQFLYNQRKENTSS